MQVIRARKAVISNASTWDTVPMLPVDAMPEELQRRATDTPQCDSFMHLHLGIDVKVLEISSSVQDVILSEVSMWGLNIWSSLWAV